MKWKTVQIPEVLLKECNECHDKFGHPSVAALVREAIRRYLEHEKTREV